MAKAKKSRAPEIINKRYRYNSSMIQRGEGRYQVFLETVEIVEVGSKTKALQMIQEHRGKNSD